MSEPRDQWYRSTQWDAEAREHFEAKLARARPRSRPQYLRLKGCALAGATDQSARDAARQLFARVIESDDQLQAAMARFDLARSLDQAGMPHEAADAYRACLQAEDRLGSLHTGSELDLVDLIVRERWEHDYDEALELLDRAKRIGLTFEVQRWRYAVALARLFARRGRDEEARQAARHALDLAVNSRPDFGRHPDVGRITADEETVRELRKLAG